MTELINAHAIKVGNAFIFEGAPVIAKSIDISKTGKHGASKCRIEADGILDGRKRVVTVPGHERFEIPEIDKRRGQVMAVTGSSASVMDLDSFETFDIPYGEDVKDKMAEGSQIEYWIVGGIKVIKRVQGEA